MFLPGGGANVIFQRLMLASLSPPDPPRCRISSSASSLSPSAFGTANWYLRKLPTFFVSTGCDFQFDGVVDFRPSRSIVVPLSPAVACPAQTANTTAATLHAS